MSGIRPKRSTRLSGTTTTTKSAHLTPTKKARQDADPRTMDPDQDNGGDDITPASRTRSHHTTLPPASPQGADQRSGEGEGAEGANGRTPLRTYSSRRASGSGRPNWTTLTSTSGSPLISSSATRRQGEGKGKGKMFTASTPRSSVKRGQVAPTGPSSTRISSARKDTRTRNPSTSPDPLDALHTHHSSSSTQSRSRARPDRPLESSPVSSPSSSSFSSPSSDIVAIDAPSPRTNVPSRPNGNVSGHSTGDQVILESHSASTAKGRRSSTARTLEIHNTPVSSTNPTSNGVTAALSESKTRKGKMRATAAALPTAGDVDQAVTAKGVEDNRGAMNGASVGSRSVSGPGPSSTLTNNGNNGKGPAPEKRVLPARIRRTAGRDGEGIRELEDMVQDWLGRWGEPALTPPDDLPIHITTLPLELVKPPTALSKSSQPHLPPVVTLTPTRAQTSIGGATMPSPSPNPAGKPTTSDLIASESVNSPLVPTTMAMATSQEKIETPTWTMVARGGDDEDEAREELSAPPSPLKRLRHAPEELEDTSDAYYQTLHRKYEAFERRQRIREKEKLIFERYKMRSRIETLRTLSQYAWAAVVNNVLSRYGQEVWVRARKVVQDRGVEWLRGQLVREGKEVLKRYDQLLPNDSRKNKPGSTPTPSLTPRPSTSPPPVIPDRVAVLRESSTRGLKRSIPDHPSSSSSSRAPSAKKAAVQPKSYMRNSRRLSESSAAKFPRKAMGTRQSVSVKNGHYKNNRNPRNGRDTRSGRRSGASGALPVPKIPGLEEEVWVVSHPKRALRFSKEETMEMKEVESEWL